MKFLEHIIINPKIVLEKGKVYPFIEMANVSTSSRDPLTVEYKKYDSGAKFEIGDSVVARITPCLQNGKRFYCKNIKKGFGSSEYLVFRPKDKEIDSRYLYYLLQTNEIKEKMIKSMLGASGRQRVNSDVFKHIDIKLPTLETQHKIADILSSYDDLIENNQKQTKLLEEAAERLYKEWFVDLHFPNYENTPIEDGIPQGWINKKLENIKCELESGSRPKGGVNNTLINGIPSLGAKDILELGEFDYNNTQYISKEYYENMKRGKIKNKDILIYKDGAYIGKTTLFQDYFPYDKAVVNEHVFLLHAKEDNIQYYLFFTLHQKEYFIKMQNLNKNSAQPGLNQKNIMSIDILMPNNYLIEQFNEKITPMMKEIFILANSITKLQEARNRLLPKLMSGEIEV